MAYPPSIYSPEYFKAQKPENHACCGGACPQPTEHKVVQKRGCFIRYNTSGGASYKTGSNGINYKVC